MQIITVPIGKLALSPRNVRRTDRAADIERLADSIATRGLKQNLVGLPNGKAGHYEIHAGGRRLQALQLLVERGVMKPTDKVAVLVDEPDQATETSLEENIQRVAMNPADELDAYRTIIDSADGDEEDRVAHCAKRFGVTTRHVEQRLRLANLATPILEDLRVGTITLDVAKAFAGTHDPDRQLAVYEAASADAKRWNRSTIDVNAARNLLRQGSVTNADPRAILIGRAAYEAAGGRVEVDLFAAIGTEQWIDVALLEQLAIERMTAQAETIRQDEGFASVTALTAAAVPYELSSGLHRWYLARAKSLTADADVAIAGLEAEQERLRDRLEEAGDVPTDDEDCPIDPELAKVWNRYEDIEEEITALRSGAGVQAAVRVPADKRARFHRFLILEKDGRTALADGWYSDGPVDDEGDPLVPIKASAGGLAAAKGGMSDSLLGELAMQRRDILAVAMAQDPGMALLYAQFVIVDRAAIAAKGIHGGNYGSSLQADQKDRWEPVSAAYGDTSSAAPHIRDAQAAQSLAWLRDELDWSWCGGLEARSSGRYQADKAGQLQRFDLFRALDEHARAALFAWAIANTLKASTATARQDEIHDRLGEVLAIDVAAWWRPTVASYFGRINVDDIKAALDEMSGETAPTTGKKGELAARAEALAAGKSEQSEHVNSLGSRWVPEAMRFRTMGGAAAGRAAE
jgi:ParB family chromosome partitioning protein